MALQGTSSLLQGSGSLIQGGKKQQVQNTVPGSSIQTANINPQYQQPAHLQGSTATGNVDTSLTPNYDPVAAAAAAKAAEDARRAAQVRGEVTGVIDTIINAYNSRYGSIDASAGEQVSKLNERFGNESSDVSRQVGEENEKVGAAYAGRGTYDSSYRGNSVDTVATAGKAQIRDLGTELGDDINKVGNWVASNKAGLDADKGAMQTILGRLADETDPNNLISLRNTLDAKLADINAGHAANYTSQQNAQALSSIAPTSARTVQLKTTLSQIVAGNADPSTKAAIGQQLIQNAQISPQEQEQLLIAFNGDLSSTDRQQQV